MKIILNFHFIFILKLFAFSFIFENARAQTNLSIDSLQQRLTNNLKHDTNRVIILNQLAYSYNSLNPLTSLRYGFEANKISDSLHFSKGAAEAFRQLGLAFWNQGNIPNSISYFLSGLRIAEDQHLSQIEADITSNIGTAYNSMGNPKEALTFLTRALVLQKALKNKVRESAVLNNMGDSYFALKKYTEATQAYAQALKISKQYHYKIGIATNFRNLGNVLETTGRYDSALAHYVKCVSLSNEINDNRGYILSNKSMASVYLKTKKLSLAKSYALVALNAATQAKLRAIVRDIYQLLYEISEAENDRANSFNYFKLFMAYKDSVQNLKVITDVASQRLLFENEKKQSEIEYLKKDAALQTEQISSRNQLIAFGSILFLLVAFWLYWGMRNAKRMKMKNDLLAARNEEVMEQHTQLKLHHQKIIELNEELHHQREEMLAQRNALAEKNLEIELMNKKIAEVNENLEQLVALRTKTLDEQNLKLTNYAFLNAHRLRAPLARIMGLANLMQINLQAEEQATIKEHLTSSAEELSGVVANLSNAMRQSSGDSFGN